jgi:hypothetical protein
MASQTAQASRGLAIVGTLMVLFGLAEVGTGFYVGWFARAFEIPRSPVYTALTAAVGALYVLSGVLVLSMRRRAAAGALVLLGLVVAGRLALVRTGAYPIDAFRPAVSVAIGTSIVVAFAGYVAWKWQFVGGSRATSRG